ncbi:dihydroxyacetone kinase phosphoryl donor subunit DhaM [Rathayibacter toxicus]|uniref:Phosphocarrier protein HPr n=1 Tax=Rathayibacter toxicus TaxID=145458 RepID=A0A0C5BS51_9MICO|nr:dihydroxyacetone kinase phosphoryl donor subunit DhaM [Rathayibacter toxicus]AJM77497.1 hypothetical protein TI83_05135 [Rathayibacter toxicus]ALS56593.1 hypothetical protein APU90_01340 [Rathayibacter toxicus]KKM44685.1 hypothetical protein VT73_09305 [Rathayibacter toxicus]PPG21579.1 HPr family phosphocarrier protein [Rathayibacter toxicus]PPG46543.1 HPr family phosphocarrier protein [Rathayibacter toxicus]
MSVGLVLVSHSATLAEGLVEFAAQMAPHVALVPAGGTESGGIGTSVDRITGALAIANSGEGVVVLCDLGSAILAAEMAAEFLSDAEREQTRIVDAPLVEGAIAAAVAAEAGAGLAEVVATAESACSAAGAGKEQPVTGVEVRRSATLINPNGLHARPAADFVTLASRFNARILANGKDATSLLAVMSLGLDRGNQVLLSATGAEAEEAVARLAALIESGFGEVMSGERPVW